MAEITNNNRANRARAAATVFQDQTKTDDGDLIADLICDLCHLAQCSGQDPINEVRRGLAMFADERDYPPDGWVPAGQFARISINIERG